MLGTCSVLGNGCWLADGWAARPGHQEHKGAGAGAACLPACLMGAAARCLDVWVSGGWLLAGGTPGLVIRITKAPE